MKVIKQTTKLTRISDVVIPSEFFNRLKTGSEPINKIFGEGILPGMTFTVFGAAGSGKSTFLLQLSQELTSSGYSCAYISGEESIHQIAYSCRRLNVSDVEVCNTTELSEILEIMNEYDFVVVDSFPTITDSTAEDMSKQALQKHIAETITAHAKQTKCSIGIILHATKSGNYKGSTEIVHTVDCNIEVERAEDVENINNILVSKNRFGCSGQHSFYCGTSGYDFETKVVIEEKDSGKGKKSVEEQKISALDFGKNGLTCQQIAGKIGLDYHQTYYYLRKMHLNGQVNREGRGQKAIYSKVAGNVISIAASQE